MKRYVKSTNKKMHLTIVNCESRNYLKSEGESGGGMSYVIVKTLPAKFRLSFSFFFHDSSACLVHDKTRTVLVKSKLWS